MGRIFLLFVLLPLVDMMLLTFVSTHLGFWNTVALVVATGLLGGWLARLEGGRAWRAWRGSLERGQLPEEGVVGGGLLLIGSVLLITPGVLTDLIGLALLIPQSRKRVADRVRPWLKKKLHEGATRAAAEGPQMHVVHFGGQAPSRQVVARRVVDAEFEVVKLEPE